MFGTTSWIPGWPFSVSFIASSLVLKKWLLGFVGLHHKRFLDQRPHKNVDVFFEMQVSSSSFN